MPSKKQKGQQKSTPWSLKTLGRVAGYARKQYLAVILVVVTVLVSTALGLLPPWLIRYGVDHLILGGQPQLLLGLAFLMVGSSLAQGLVDFLTRYTSEYVSLNVIHDLRVALYHHLNGLSFSFYDSSRTGDILSRITGDADLLRQFLSNAIVYIAGNLLTILGVWIVMFLWEPRLAVLYMLMLPLMIHAMHNYATRVRPMFQQARRRFGKLTEQVHEGLVGIEVIKLFGREKKIQECFALENEEYAKAHVAAAKVSALWMPYVHFLIGLGTALVIWYGGRLVINEHISLGTLVGFVGYIAMLMRPIRQTGMMMNASAQAIAGAERIFAIMDTPQRVQDQKNALELPAIQGKVEYKDVSFAYGDGNTVLDKVCLVAYPGQTIAIVGPTGAGKSTLVHLLARFYDLDRGEIMIDGYNIKDVKLESLRGQIGIVLQSNFLFAASIRENISYGRPDASMEQIIACARTACIHDFIAGLPLGYETPVGERGVTLSGGQRQRIWIARSLLTNPRLLILDEPTSSLDAETEEKMQAAFSAVTKNRTTFVIAHRLWTVKNADQILVVNNHKIVERGTHTQLVEKGGYYSELYQCLFAPKEEQRGGVSKP